MNKFRVWHKELKQWMNYDEIFIDQEGEVFIIEERSWAYQSYMHKERVTEQVTVVNYTGLKDKKNNKEIFDGDVIKAVSYSGYETRNEVTFLNGCWMFGNWNAHEFFNRHQYIEVIGNIYENPKLLEQLS